LPASFKKKRNGGSRNWLLRRMHQALCVSEVLLEIFPHLTCQKTADLRSSLAALARTCKNFHKLAMDLLWANTGLNGIDPLLGCVTRLHPLIYCHGINSWPHSESWSPGVEPLSEDEAHQFLRHAARVRSLTLTKDHFRLLAVLPVGACVFPRLWSLDCGFFINTRLDLFLFPTLKRCVLHQCHPLLVHSDLKSIATRCPVLETLSIGSKVVDTNQLSLLSDFIRSCERLKDLTCPELDYAAWKHLSKLPTLVAVSITPGLSKVLLDWDHVNFAPFLNVTTLHFRINFAADIITLIRHSQFPSLKKF